MYQNVSSIHCYSVYKLYNTKIKTPGNIILIGSLNCSSRNFHVFIHHFMNWHHFFDLLYPG